MPEEALENLRQRIAQRAAQALTAGVLHPLATSAELVHDQGVDFVVHLLSHLEKKTLAGTQQRTTRSNPFLPHDPALWVCDVAPAHRLLLNKFNVLAHHLLIVTREFRPQEELLDLADLTALVAVLRQVDGLAFYNAGVIAGASQPHKHLQLVSLPLGPDDAPCSVHRLLQRAGTCPGFSFPHAATPLAPSDSLSTAQQAQTLWSTYRELLQRLGITGPGQPYNLLLTRHWAMVVPRCCEHFEGISVNALGFAGSLLAPSTQALERIKQIGPMKVLEAVAGQCC